MPPRRPPAPLRTVFASNLRRERVAAGLSQEELAEKSGLSTIYISQLELAKKSASLDAIHQLAQALELDAWQLLK